MNKKLFFLMMVSLFFISCGKRSLTPQKSNLTYGTVKKKVVKGLTNQNEIIQLFGSPNLITKNRESNEVWSYNKMSVDRNSSGYGAWLLLIGSEESNYSTSTSSFDFIVIFDKNDIVKDYSVIVSNY